MPYRYDRRAARPIHIDRADLDRVINGFRSWATNMARVHGPDLPAGDVSDGYLDSFHSIVVAFLPSTGMAGGFGYLQGQPLIKVFFDKRLHWRSLSEPSILHELRVVLSHELTHALDRLGPTLLKNRPDQPTLLEDIDPKAYFNDPDEVRAHMRELFERIRDQVLSRMESPLKERWGLGKIITVALASQPKWRVMEPHLNHANRNRILKGLVTAFLD